MVVVVLLLLLHLGFQACSASLLLSRFPSPALKFRKLRICFIMKWGNRSVLAAWETVMLVLRTRPSDLRPGKNLKTGCLCSSVSRGSALWDVFSFAQKSLVLLESSEARSLLPLRNQFLLYHITPVMELDVFKEHSLRLTTWRWQSKLSYW